MSDRANIITIVLDKDYRIGEDLQPILEAIRMIKGVQAADANVADQTEYLAIERAKTTLRTKLFEVVL